MNVDLAELDLFFGDANAAETRVYARLAGVEPGNGLSLSGKLTGPFCVYSQTLPATIPLVDQGPDAALLAQAIVPDPCFWSPELPMLYNVHVELRRGAEVLGQLDRTVGIRPLGARGQRLVYEGKTWVLRAVSQQAAPEAILEQWREADTALLAQAPEDDLCQQASRIGVLVIAEVSGDAASIASELRRLSRWAAVGMAIIRCDEPLLQAIRAQARNLILIEPVRSAGNPPAPWAHVRLVDEHSIPPASNASLPLLVRASDARRASEAKPADIADARRQCDALQRDLATQGQFAGYLI